MHRYIPFLIMAAVVLIAIIAVEIFRYRIARKGRRSPFTPQIVRSPGQSLLKRLDALNGEISIQAAAFVALPITIYAAHLSYLYFGKHPFHWTGAMAAGIVAIVFMGYTLFKLLGFLDERRNVRLGCEGEMIVGQALNMLMLKGYRVYHDFPADTFTIDHIVVGEKGVFAVETKTRSRRTTTDRREDATVEYDGRALHFPKGTDIEMIDQAKRQSKWLANWLHQALGEELTARSILVLPGWFVRRTAPKGIPVINPKQLDSLFEYVQSRSLSPEMITRITHLLDQKCRDIEPQA